MRGRRRLLASASAALAVSLAGTGAGAGTATRPGGPVGFPLQAIGGLAQPLDAFLGEAAAASAAVPAGIVRSVGTHLVLDGQPWRFTGYNDYKLTSQTYNLGFTCGGEHPDAEVDTDFALMRARGTTVVRTWFFQSFVAGRNWSAFDRVLTDASRYGIKVIPVLANEFGTCESFNYTPDIYKGIDWYRSGYLTDHQYGLPKTYHDYALEVVKHYAGDPRIAFWQLMNEAEANSALHGQCDEAGAAHALRSFADAMTAAVKEVDPVHLVSLGTIGGGQCGTAGPDYTYIHAGAIDICEYHDYATAPSSGPRHNLCLSLHKPIFVGERGFNSDAGTGQTTSQTLQKRADYFTADVTSLFADDSCVGYLVWSWSNGASQGQDVGPDDPLGVALAAVARTMTGPAAVSASLWLANHHAPPLSDS